MCGAVGVRVEGWGVCVEALEFFAAEVEECVVEGGTDGCFLFFLTHCLGVTAGVNSAVNLLTY